MLLAARQRRELALKMYLMYHVDEDGKRTYTLKVCIVCVRWWAGSTPDLRAEVQAAFPCSMLPSGGVARPCLHLTFCKA